MPLSMTVNSAQKLEDCSKWLSELWTKKKWLKVSVEPSKRSLSANALSHVWYADIAKFNGETPEQSKCYCKLNFGIGILRANEKRNAFFMKINFDSFSYQEQLAAMKYIDVTRLFTVDEMKDYLNHVQAHFSQNGLVLESNKED